MPDDEMEISTLSGYTGRSIKPTGSIYRLSFEAVSQMTDIQLLDHIKQLKEELHEAERFADQKRVCLTIATGQLEENREKLRRKLRNIHVTPTSIKIGVDARGFVTKESFGASIERWKKAGKSDSEILDMISKMRAFVEASKEKKNGKANA